MNSPTTARAWLALSIMVFGCSLALAEDAVQPNVAEQSADTRIPVRSPYRQLAPGVLITVDPMRSLAETVSRHDLVGLLAVDPKFDWAKDIAFRHDVWVLKFQFKPMRMIWVDVPQPGGNMERKLIWYLVYAVTNVGKVMHPVADANLSYEVAGDKKLYEIKSVDRPIRFLPEFLLEGHLRVKDDPAMAKVYPDRVIPIAIDPIRMREDPKRRFLNSTEISREIAVGETLWGVATWEDVDPRIVKFSVYAFGLTNAYMWKDDPSQVKPDSPPMAGRKIYRKTLQLNFWRPGDEYFEHEAEIRFGSPDVEDAEGVDYQWVYR